MELQRELISKFAKITTAKEQPPSEVIVYGTAYKDGENYLVRLDGAADGALTPVSSTVEVSDGERVTVMIKNHAATITGNFSEPAAKNSEVVEARTDLDEARTDLDEAQSDIEEVQQNKVEKTEVVKSINETEETELIKASRLDVEDIFAQNITANGLINFANDFYEIAVDDLAFRTLTILSRGRLALGSKNTMFLISTEDIDISAIDGPILLNSNLGVDGVKTKVDTNEYTFINTGNLDIHIGNIVKDYVIERGSGGGDSSITWIYRKRKSGAVELWGRRAISDRACNTSFGGGMYRTSLIEVANFPFKVYYPNVQVSYEPSNGYGAFVWPYSAATADHPASYYLMRPTIPDTNLAGYLNFYVRGSLVE